jgi:proline dehydrogenase
MPGIGERLLYPVAKRWIAGYELDDAIKAAQDANSRKIRAIVNRLGEHTPDVNRIEEYTQEYLKIPEELEKEHIDGTISVKPSQLGLAIEVPLYKKNLVRILENAEPKGLDVWIDMENSPYTESTLQVYRELFEDHPKIGICLQANLKRTENDVKSLVSIGGRVRLVKGAYPESGEIAYKGRRAVDENFVALLKTLFAEGDNFVLGTHDTRLIEEGQRLGKEQARNFEFAMLKGIRDDMKEKLVVEGYRVGEYIPYGPEWYNYSKRRMRERKRNILLLARSLFS